MPRLENWSVVVNNKPFTAPELLNKRLNGEIHDDEKNRFENGTKITTSPIIKFDLKNKTAQTHNTQYVLGIPSEDYLKWMKDNNIEL